MIGDILNITDGTTTLNLYNLTDGYSVTGWRQAIAQYKGGGIFQDSSIATGRRLALRRHANALETIPINVSGATSDIAAAALRDLTALLEKAADYWEHDWQNDPVWLEVKDSSETETRYALIVMGQIPDIPDQHSLVRTLDSVVYDGLSLIVEHQHWTENQPGTGTAVALSMIQTYDGRTLGNVDDAGTREPTTNDYQVYMANKHNVAQLTDIYYLNFFLALWSPNLLDAALPTSLMNPVPGVGDCIVFGIDSTLADSGPFNSLAFDLSETQADLTMQWEYWNGAGWTVFGDLQDNTDTGGAMLGDPFDTLGRGTVHWWNLLVQPAWVTGNLLAIFGGVAPNVTGWWVRCLVTAIGAAPDEPVQQNRDIYTITWGCTEVQADITTGDIASLAEWRLLNLSATSSAAAHATQRMFLGLRSYDRGPNFQAYLNFGDTQLVTGQTNNVVSGAHNNDSTSVTGRNFTYTPAGAGTVRAYWMNLDSFTLSNEFYGTFRVFMRVDQTAAIFAGAEAKLEYRVGQFQQTYAESPWVMMNRTISREYHVYDFGTVNIPGINISTIADWRIELYIRATTGPYPTYTFRDIILIPADEWIIDAVAPSGRALTLSRYLSLDSISWPKNWLNTVTIFPTLLELIDLWSARSADISQLVKRGERQRLWGLYVNPNNYGPPKISHWVQCLKNDRYLSPRGSS